MDKIKRISDVVSELRTVLLETGMKATTIAFVVKRMEKASEQELDSAYFWLVGFKEVHVTDYQNVMLLTPPEVWKNYACIGMVRGTYELDKRREIIKLMHNAWRARPVILTRGPEGKANVKARRPKK